MEKHVVSYQWFDYVLTGNLDDVEKAVGCLKHLTKYTNEWTTATDWTIANSVRGWPAKRALVLCEDVRMYSLYSVRPHIMGLARYMVENQIPAAFSKELALDLCRNKIWAQDWPRRQYKLNWLLPIEGVVANTLIREMEHALYGTTS